MSTAIDGLFIAFASVFATLAVDTVLATNQLVRLVADFKPAAFYAFQLNKRTYETANRLRRRYTILMIVWLLLSCVYVLLFHNTNIWLYVVIAVSLMTTPAILKRLLAQRDLLWQQVYAYDHSLQQVLKEATRETIEKWDDPELNDAFVLLGYSQGTPTQGALCPEGGEKYHQMLVGLLMEHLAFYRSHEKHLALFGDTDARKDKTLPLSESIKML
jgi:hypothetical protein